MHKLCISIALASLLIAFVVKQLFSFYLIAHKECPTSITNNKSFERQILYKNRALKAVFDNALFVWEKPLVISNIKFTKQALFNEDMLFVGDAAGSISPLSGNGMSIAARSAVLLAQLIQSEQPFDQLAKQYSKEWDKLFGNRINKAELLNTIMLNPNLHHVVLQILKNVKLLRNKVVNDMSGEAFTRYEN